MALSVSVGKEQLRAALRSKYQKVKFTLGARLQGGVRWTKSMEFDTGGSPQLQ